MYPALGMEGDPFGSDATCRLDRLDVYKGVCHCVSPRELPSSRVYDLTQEWTGIGMKRTGLS